MPGMTSVEDHKTTQVMAAKTSNMIKKEKGFILQVSSLPYSQQLSTGPHTNLSASYYVALLVCYAAYRVVAYRRFGTAHRSHFQGSSRPQACYSNHADVPKCRWTSTRRKNSEVGKSSLPRTRYQKSSLPRARYQKSSLPRARYQKSSHPRARYQKSSLPRARY